MLDVLRGGMGIKRSKAYGSRRQRPRSQHGRAEVHASVEKRGRGREVIGLLRLRENVRDIVPLVAPRV